MEIKAARRALFELPAPLKVVGVTPSGLLPQGQALDRALGGGLGQVLKETGFKGEAGETLLVARPEGAFLLFGLGKKRGQDLDRLREHGGRLAQALDRLSFREAAVEVFFAEELGRKEAAYALAEGLYLGSYRFLKYKKEEGKRLRVLLAQAPGAEVERARVVAEAVNYARDLVNEPPNVLTPAELARRALALAEEVGLEAEVWDEERIQAEGMGAFLAVAKGSANPPRFIKLVYRPSQPSGRLALVGKGLTFDTGGYSLKPTESMSTMKGDMAGAAAVLGAMRAVAQLRPSLEVRAYIAAAENMISGSAYRVQDILKSYSGKTIEVLNTDAEGRLTLADALAYAEKEGAEAIVELSTLTGAAVVALGEKVAALFSTDPRLERRLLQAAKEAGEKVWPMPLEEAYREKLKSEFADLKNVGDRGGGAITAALFLAEFVKVPFAHLDIAGPAYASKPHPLGPVGGTGFGVRTLLRFLQ
ncbi:leucyl aminopeptidase [Thermus filiformis]|uniref:Probable cytosol aminopeptidase n=1 Tax=Thermus filiformis TaxID=276 RepID=A0A0A2WLS0_THEFI|nr:leucyl aminopeptidase [Thermus filiformis]KGQ21136.1 leucyl aminopeptidase [Thermus filiformis]